MGEGDDEEAVGEGCEEERGCEEEDGQEGVSAG